MIINFEEAKRYCSGNKVVPFGPTPGMIFSQLVILRDVEHILATNIDDKATIAKMISYVFTTLESLKARANG